MMSTELDALLGRFAPHVGDLARSLVATVEELRPDFAGKVQRGWGSVNFRHPKAGFVCAVFPSDAGHVDLVFEHGRLLSSPLLTDNGKARQVRWIRLVPGDEIPTDEIGILLAEAVALKA